MASGREDGSGVKWKFVTALVTGIIFAVFAPLLLQTGFSVRESPDESPDPRLFYTIFGLLLFFVFGMLAVWIGQNVAARKDSKPLPEVKPLRIWWVPIGGIVMVFPYFILPPTLTSNVILLLSFGYGFTFVLGGVSLDIHYFTLKSGRSLKDWDWMIRAILALVGTSIGLVGTIIGYVLGS